jgi:lysophospholipase L1-like esterase
MLKKIGFVFLSLCMVLLFLEVALRLYAAWYSNTLAQIYKRQNNDSVHKLKILAVGESTTAGLWVEDRSYPIQLKQMLEGYYSCKGCVEINILTLPGNTSGALQNLPSYLIKYKPNIVIFMVGYNDFAFYEYNVDVLLLEKFFTKNIYVYKVYLKLVEVLNEIRVFRIIKLAYVSFAMPRNTYYDAKEVITNHGQVSAERERFSDLKPIERFIERQMQTNIEKMIDITRLNNAIPILVTHPVCRTNNIIRVVAKKKNVSLVDNELEFSKLKDFASYVFKKSPSHPNEKGYKIIAENIMKHMLLWKLIKK